MKDIVTKPIVPVFSAVLGVNPMSARLRDSFRSVFATTSDEETEPSHRRGRCAGYKVIENHETEGSSAEKIGSQEYLFIQRPVVRRVAHTLGCSVDPSIV